MMIFIGMAFFAWDWSAAGKRTGSTVYALPHFFDLMNLGKEVLALAQGILPVVIELAGQVALLTMELPGLVGLGREQCILIIGDFGGGFGAARHERLVLGGELRQGVDLSIAYGGGWLGGVVKAWRAVSACSWASRAVAGVLPVRNSMAAARSMGVVWVVIGRFS